jgi:hypothetical protein
MCGIVGLFSKSSEIEEQLGSLLSEMLVQLSDRGPDSAGVAVYREPAPAGWSKLTLASGDPLYDWDGLTRELEQVFGACSDASVRSSHAVIAVGAEAAEVEAWSRGSHP